MIVRELKLKLTKKQEVILNEWLWILTGLYNFVCRKIKLDASDGFYHSKYKLRDLFKGHAKKIGIPSQTVQAIIVQARDAWDKCFKKIRKGEPKLKSIRNKLRSIPFPAPIQEKHFSLESKKVKLPIIGELRFYKQEIPEGKIKVSRIVKKASGWYLQITIDAKHTFQVKETEKKVGIDTGFKDLAILSDGQKYKNHRYYVKGQKRLAQAQRGINKKLVARLHERTANRRKDHNHKVSRKIVENNKEIYITNDNLRGQSKIFGKSVSDVGISQLRNFIIYKGDNHNRKVKLVESKYTTMTCSNCYARTGPTGLNGLAVRYWECNACRAYHDRDINSAKVILNIGAGLALELNA
jgi:putative transposase